MAGRKPPTSSWTACLLLACAFLAQQCAGAAPACPPDLPALVAAAETREDGEKVLYTAVVPYATGNVSAYVTFSASDPCAGPTGAGIEISDAALANLPSPSEVENQPPEYCTGNATAPGCFPRNDIIFLNGADQLGAYNPFAVYQFDWNPEGHIPDGVYNVPHFDFHAYLVPQDDVIGILPGPCSFLAPENFTAAHQPLPNGCFPSGYTNMVGATTPMMGNHLLDLSGPEFIEGSAAFNVTYIWGAYSGEIIFFEVMAARTFVETRPDYCVDIPGMPSAFSIAGFKPRTYCMTPTPSSIRVEFRDYTWYDAGCTDTSDVDPASAVSVAPGTELPEICVLPTA